MSHSSLSAQLASLNAAASGGKNVGSTLGTSKRHEDAVGRGIAHSATHGHSVIAASAKFKPSVLYADAKTASDVPLTTLRENSVSSLRQLARLTQNEAFVEPSILQSLMGAHSLNFERGLATRAENDKTDKTIVGLLYLLSTAMGDSSASCLTASLHVIEYLLRRYDIHLRASTAEGLLLAALPHHELPIFLRILQLLDLASLPTWVFLRPHAAKGSPPPSRTLIAKRASRDNAIMLNCCELAKKAANIHAQECENSDSLTSPSSPRRGVSRIISFAAAVLVEAFSLQTTIPTNQGSIAEPTLRCVFPFILSACGDNKASKKYSSRWSLGILCPDWRGFGHLLAATISERSVLSPEISQVLSTTLMKGALEIDRFLAASEQNAQVDQERLGSAADCILVVMTVLANAGEDTAHMDLDSHLEIIAKHTAGKSSAVFTLGYSIATSTYRVLKKHNLLANALGHLSLVRNVEVAPLMSSLLKRGMLNLFKESSSEDVESARSTLLELVQESSLESVWTDSKFNIAASFSAALVVMFANHQPDEEPGTDILESIRSLLDALRAVDSTGCDAGIAHAVTSVCRRGGGRGSRSIRRKRVSILMGAQFSALENTKGDDQDDAFEIDDEPMELLPPRIALEHPDKTIRLRAIDRVMEELTGMDIQDDKAEPLEHALLRRMNTEDDVQVAAAAGKNLVKLLTVGHTKYLNGSFVRTAVAALTKWSVFLSDFDTPESEAGQRRDGRKSGKVVGDRLELLFSTLLAASYATRWLIQRGASELDTQRMALIQGIVAHLDFIFAKNENNKALFEEVAQHAAEALHLALGVKRTQQKKASNRVKFDAAKHLLVSHEICSSVLRQCCSSEGNSERMDTGRTGEAMHERRYIWVVLMSFSECLEKGSPSREMVSDAIVCSLHILRSCRRDEKIEEANTTELLQCLQLCARDISARHITSIPDTILSLAAISSSRVFQDVSTPAISYFCESVTSTKGNPVSALSIIMEASTRASASHEAVEKLLSIASDCISFEDSTIGSLEACVIPAMMLLGSDSQRIRRATLGIFGQISSKLLDKDSTLKVICNIASNENGSDGMYSTLLINGEVALAKLVTSGLQISKKPAKLRECLIRRCFLSVLACDVDHESEWLPLGCASGGCRAAGFVLKVLEAAGESTFPLAMRWKHAGKDIAAAIQNAALSEGETSDTEALHALIDSVATMLKGVAVDSPSLPQSSVVISTGPDRRGRRVRSYSVGKLEGISYVKPYPDDMYQALVACMSPPLTEAVKKNPLSRALILRVVRKVFTRSWGESVFKELPHDKREEIAARLLDLRTTITDDSVSETALHAITLRATDLSHLIETAEEGDEYLPVVTFLSEWVRTNSATLIQDDGLDQLISALFEVLSYLSSSSGESKIDVDEAEYSRHAILRSLYSLSRQSEDSTIVAEIHPGIPSRTKLIVGLVGGSFDEDKSLIRPLVSSKAKAVAVSLLTNLCSKKPPAVVDSLVPALMATMVSTRSDGSENVRASRAARDAFMGVVPVFCRHATASGLSLFNLVVDFIMKCEEFSENGDKLLMYENLVDAVLSTQKSDRDGASIGSIVAAFLANELQDYRNESDMLKSRIDSTKGDEHNDATVAFASDFLAFAPEDVQVDALRQLLRYLNQFLVNLCVPSEDESDHKVLSDCGTEDSMVIPFHKIEHLALNGLERNGSMENRTGHYDAKQRRRVMRFSTSSISLLREIISSGSVSKLLKKSEGPESALGLTFWQDLLCTQAAVFDLQPSASEAVIDWKGTKSKVDKSSSVDARFWDSMKQRVTESLECLQILLPAHTFLASASSLIRETTVSDELRARAVRLVAEKATEAAPDSAEASMFLDMLPIFVDLLAPPAADNPSESAILLRQSSLTAIEHVARSMHTHLDYEKIVAKHSKAYVSALEKVAGVLDGNLGVVFTSGKFSAIDDGVVQLHCSAALCSSTLVRVLKARCLPLLPRVVEPLTTSLISANTYLNSGSIVVGKEGRSTLKTLQLSNLRAMLAVAETLPQFLLPYLSKLLSPQGLPSRALHVVKGDQDATVKSTTELIQDVVSSRTPSRQLVPVACQAVSSGGWGTDESLSLVSIVETSVRSSKKDEIPSLIQWVLKVLKIVYERGAAEIDSTRMFDAGHSLLLALVLKMSETQLRPMYTDLREWRESNDSNTCGKQTHSKTLAFWSLSAVLARELRSIFLPCMSTVVADAIEELDFAASSLCSTNISEKSSGGNKKRRLAVTVDEGGNAKSSAVSSFRHLQPLLLCLESALKSDAHEGGNWARADDGERFNLLLTPLGMLLRCKIPSDLLTENSSLDSQRLPYHAFRRVIMGIGQEESGSVIGCLTALAAAAGNEQLWKPLNHRVLEACDNGRSEVRMAGVSCLLSLMKTLGEEYMVLLPECLPTLAELLEDTDEEIAKVAQQCVSLGEELLGESLQERLH